MSLWTIQTGANFDRGYENVRNGHSATERRLRADLDAMWAIYEPYADPDFRDGFARDPDARFWEMFLGVQLLDAGKELLPSAERRRRGGRPDICVLENGRRIWIEAIAPDVGEAGPDQVVGPKPINAGGRALNLAPTRQAQLRITSALWTKSQVITTYLNDGVIDADDVRIVAIGGGRFGIYASEDPLPLVLSAVFPIGDFYVTLDRQSDEITRQGFHPSFEIERRGGAIPRTAFIDERFSHISGLIWSRVGIGNCLRAQRPITLVHNPLATIEPPQGWRSWDREFVAKQQGDHWVATDIRAGED
jgi:hypothetical protein